MQNQNPPNRNRYLYIILMLFVIGSGLASRKYHGIFPTEFGKYPGDALWALMVFLGLGILQPTASIFGLAVTALCISFLDEFSQLYQAPWINSIRSTTLGHLVLGSTFNWPDLLAYTVGVSCGVLFEISIHTIQDIYKKIHNTDVTEIN